MIRFLKAALLFARHQAWVDEPRWTRDDAEGLGRYLQSASGANLKATLVNMALRQQAAAVSHKTGLEYEAGYCTGQRAAIVAIEALADIKQFTGQGEDGDADHATS